MRILGISCFYHDAAACLVEDGEVRAAAEEERFTRRKHDPSFPGEAVRSCLELAGCAPDAVDAVVFYEKPLLKLERILASCAATFPWSRALFVRATERWLGEKLWVGQRLRGAVPWAPRMLFCEHHVSHAASAFYPSPFHEAAVLTADGVGEWATTTIGVGSGCDLQLLSEVHFPHSLGLLYSAFTAFLGFEVNEGEYKVMGLAAYGRPRYVDAVRRLVHQAEDGSFRLDMRFFAYHRGFEAPSARFADLFGRPRAPDEPLEQRHADLAASIQAVTEDAMVRLAPPPRRFRLSAAVSRRRRRSERPREHPNPPRRRLFLALDPARARRFRRGARRRPLCAARRLPQTPGRRATNRVPGARLQRRRDRGDPGCDGCRRRAT